MLILTEEGIIAARDKWGRTPIPIGRKKVPMRHQANLAASRIWDMK